MADEPTPTTLAGTDPVEHNPVRRARLTVEAEVPPERRGPGWDRHWRELEAYVEDMGEWSHPSEINRD